MKLEEDFNKTLPIVELYTAVQSEGKRAGMPTIVVRTTGCTHRCFFGEGGWCDSWQTSIHPEKGKYSINDILKMYDENPHIKEMMLTGGSPTMHPKLVNTLTHEANKRNVVITMESEGSHYLRTDFPLGLISISPKFSNSIPVVGEETPGGKIVDEKMIKTHNRMRLNTEAIAQSIMYHGDYQFKPVWDGKNMKIIEEFEEFLDNVAQLVYDLDLTFGAPKSFILQALKDNTYFMPAGDSRESLMESYPLVMNWVRDNGYKMTFRPHIIAFDTERYV